MEPERLDRVAKVCQGALDRPESERAVYLAEVCGEDQALRQEVESLLRHDQQAGSTFLQPPRPELVAHAIGDGSSPAAPGSAEDHSESSMVQPASIGPYRLIRKLGEGGMGQVWLAEQIAPLRRQVALKLIRAGMYDQSLLQRFQAERQSLAIMDHPAIAKVFDAGATPQGQPYFVMEYVDGKPIDAYCDEKQLTIRERLELLIKVCEAVQHAHQKAIIHRDLKPPNILVTEVDGKPAPRIIDFGIAKATSPLAGDESLTRVGGFVGTPAYMSPEQADPTVRDIDTRTDVYSLGVVLYVLLTSSLPHDTKEWKNLPYDEVLRRLREDDPVRPSTSVSTNREALTKAAQARQSEPKQLVSQLRGDLDWITMKALEKDRDRRYATPLGLAADIGRHLRNEPVVAAPPGTVYRARKYVRRHRLGVAVAAGLAMLLVAFSVMQAKQLRRTQRERDRANRITDFMTGMFKVSDPSQARGNSITAREILDKASKDIDTGLSKDPELRAQMMDVMGTVYDNLGLYPRAESLLTTAVDIRRGVLGPNSPDTASSMQALGGVFESEGRYAEAEKLERQDLEIRRRVLGKDDPRTLSSMLGLGGVLYNEGRYAEAEKLQRETLDAERRLNGPDALATLDSMANLAPTLAGEGHFADAEKLQKGVVDGKQRILGPEDPATLDAMHNLANILLYEGHFTDAESLLREVLDIQRHILGPEHPDTLRTMSNLAAALVEEGRPEAEQLTLETRDLERRVLGPDHPQTAASTYNLACMAARQGHADQAMALLRDSVDHGLGPVYLLGIPSDPDLKTLHDDPRFDPIVADARQKAAAAQKSK